MFLRPSGSKKPTKQAQNNLTRMYRSKYHDLGCRGRSNKAKHGHPRAQSPPRSDCGGGHSYGRTFSLARSVFFAAVRILCVSAVRSLDFAYKSSIFGCS